MSEKASQNPLEFLKTFAGKRVSLKASGIFDEDLIDRRGVVLKTERIVGYLEGKYKIEIDGFGDVLLRYPYHIISIVKLEWIEVNGQRVGD